MLAAPDPSASEAWPRPATEFQRCTAVTHVASGRLRGQIDPGWSTPAGPNGGYVAALITRALEAALNPDGARRLRSLTVHYLRPPDEAEMEFEVELVRSGRRFSTGRLSGRQQGKEIVTALAAFAVPDMPTAATWTPTMPDVAPAPPYDAPESDRDTYRIDNDRLWLSRLGGAGTLAAQLHLAPRIGGRPFAGTILPGQAPHTGGWLVVGDEPQPLDSAYVALCTDAWWPPAFEALTGPANAATIDLTIHIRAEIPPGGLPGQPVLGHYVSTAAMGGLMEEDGALFLADGTLLAQSRQLALLAPLTPS